MNVNTFLVASKYVQNLMMSGETNNRAYDLR